MTEPLQPKPASLAFTREELALLATQVQAAEHMRSVSQKVKTAVLNIFQYSPALFDVHYKTEQRNFILDIVREINSFSRSSHPRDQQAAEQHVFAILAKKLAYRDFSCLTPNMRENIVINIPINGKIIPYRFHSTTSLTNFSDSTILVAEGAPPIVLVPGTCTRWDSPGKMWETIGANLQGSTWKPVADGFIRTMLPQLANLSGTSPSAYIIGHSAGASAIRQVLSRHNSLTPQDKATLLAARFHAFNPPATSKVRAQIIDEIQKQKDKPIFTTYLEAYDPISHMSGIAHAGQILISPPDERSIVTSHTDTPEPRRLNGLLVTPYNAEYLDEWSLNMVLAKTTIGAIAIVNLLGINAALSTAKPIIKALTLTCAHLLTAAVYLSMAAIYQRKESLHRGAEALQGFGKDSARLVLSIAMTPFRFIYTYWNKIIAPAIYVTTGKEFYLYSYKLDILGQ